MAKLNQIIAVEKGVKNTAFQTITEAHQVLQKQALLSGISRSYTPLEEEGERLPAEATRVQINAGGALKDVTDALERLFDVSATREWANQSARADILVDGQILLTGVPVTYLLFLEKQLVDIHTFVKKLPVLDPSENWHYDNNVGAYATDSVETARTKKVPRVLEKAPATDKHPAQVEVYHEDIRVGTWKTTKFSGALPAREIMEILVRVEKLQQAVKFAREEANSLEVSDIKVGEKIFRYLLG